MKRGLTNGPRGKMYGEIPSSPIDLLGCHFLSALNTSRILIVFKAKEGMLHMIEENKVQRQSSSGSTLQV